MPSPDVTQLLMDLEAGKRETFDRLLGQVYDELKKLARSKLRYEKSGQTMNTTGLVHEAYIRLADYKKMNWKTRAHFFGAASQAMRRILVDHARANTTNKRQGQKIGLTGVSNSKEVSMEQLLEIDQALIDLSKTNPEWVNIVECRYFVGLTIEETAEALGLSQSKVKENWRMARAWLALELEG